MAKKLLLSFIENELNKENYKLLPNQKYLGSNKPLLSTCNNGHNIVIKWDYWKDGNRCATCKNKNIKLTIDFLEEELLKENYKLLPKQIYKNNKTKLMVICPKGHNINLRWNDWQSGYRCKICSGSLQKTITEIEEELLKENYKLLPKQIYKNNKTKLMVICPKGHNINLRWNDWVNNHRCLMCWRENQESKYIKQIELILLNYNVNFQKELIIKQCKNIKPLPFDFGLLINNKLIALIEFQGEQHYLPINFWGGIKNFEQQKKRDQIKQQYCKDNNIPLLIIPYWSKTIEKDIQNFIGELYV